MDQQKERYMKMTVQERKAVADAVKGGTAYRTWLKQSRKAKIKYIITLILFFVFLGLDRFFSSSKTLGDVMSMLLIIYCVFAIVFLVIDSFWAKTHPLVWKCPNCGAILPCRSSNYGKGSEAYIPDVYVDHCPSCHHDLTK